MFIPVVILTSSVHPEDVRSAYGLGANGYLDKLSDEVPWDEMVRTTARYWLGMNITPNSFAGQKDRVFQARKTSSSYGGENWRSEPDLAKLRDLSREEAIRVALLIYGWSAAEAAERVDAEQGDGFPRTSHTARLLRKRLPRPRANISGRSSYPSSSVSARLVKK